MTETTTHPARRAAGALGGDLLFYALMWGAIGAGLLALNLAGSGIWGEVDGSVWNGTASLFQYAMLGGGVMVGAGYLPVYLSHGVTRRDFTTGALVAVTGLAAGAAVATTVGFGIEHLVFQVADWPHVLRNEHEMNIYDRPDQYGLIVVELFGLYLTHVIAGLVIIAGLFRLGWLWGLPAILAGTAIAVGAEMALASGFAGVALNDWLGLTPPPVGVGIAIVAALAVAGAVLTRALIAGMTIDASDSGLWR